MPEQMKDPRLIEIELLAEIDRATFVGRPYSYSHPNPSGGELSQREDALLHLILDGAVMNSLGYERNATASRVPPLAETSATLPLDVAIRRTTQEFFSQSIVTLFITQRGRLRLYRLRDEILNRDRVRDDFGVLWSNRHWIPDLDVKLRFHKPGDPFSILVLDVDRLKALNTKFSHPGANEVLKGIFQMLQAAVAPAEAYRLGGDEAGAVLPGVDLGAAVRIAEGVRSTVEGAFRDKVLDEQGHTPTVTLAVGCLTTPMPAGDLYHRVDSHLTRKKDQGGERNKVHDLTVVP